MPLLGWIIGFTFFLNGDHISHSTESQQYAMKSLDQPILNSNRLWIMPMQILPVGEFSNEAKPYCRFRKDALCCSKIHGQATEVDGWCHGCLSMLWWSFLVAPNSNLEHLTGFAAQLSVRNTDKKWCIFVDSFDLSTIQHSNKKVKIMIRSKYWLNKTTFL